MFYPVHQQNTGFCEVKTRVVVYSFFRRRKYVSQTQYIAKIHTHTPRNTGEPKTFILGIRKNTGITNNSNPLTVTNTKTRTRGTRRDQRNIFYIILY